MEFCSLGDLSHYIKDVRTNKSAKGPAGGLPERVVRHYLKQLGKSNKKMLQKARNNSYLLFYSKCATIPKVAEFSA